MRWPALAWLLSGCISLPWGSGGASIVAPERELAGGLVRQLGPEALGRASERLALALDDRWGPFVLPSETKLGELVTVAWNGLAVELGQVALEVGPTGLEGTLQLSAAPHDITVTRPIFEPCTVSLALGSASVKVSLELAADKLGRVQASVRGDVRLDGAPIVYSDCTFNPTRSGTDEPDDPLVALIEQPLLTALEDALAPGLAAELGPALGTDLALQWSSPFAADAIGTGFVRASVRGRAEDLVTVSPPHLLIAFAVGIEAEAHPCMAPLALPAPASDGPSLPPRRDGTDGALMMRLGALEQALQAAWVAGAVCADHGRVAVDDPVMAGEIAAAWPALARYDEASALRLELWPEALPTLVASDEGGVRVETGRIAIEVWIEDGAWWRAATVIVSTTIEGELSAGPDGLVWLDPTRLEVYPAGAVDGLVRAPTDGALETILAPLVHQLISARPLTRLPPSARPAQLEVFEIGLDHAILLP